MSDDGGSSAGSSSDSDDLSTTGLIATRAKRSTAGNLYATLRANLDDEELQKDLLAEDEDEDAGDYEGSDHADDDEALDSSSDSDDDAGPPKEGDAEDLEGERALKKQERAEQRQKRKAADARLKLPAWRRPTAKRVKLADDVKTEDGNTSEPLRPRKKSERANWLPSPADAPTRQSARSLAVANREVIHANLKQSAARSENQRRVMKDAAERDRKKKWMDSLTQEQRMKKCERIERETAKELGRWEREEAERQRLREEALAAKRKRGIDGPVFRQWSGSALWVGDKLKVRRLSHGSTNVEEIILPHDGAEKRGPSESAGTDWPGTIRPSMAAHTFLEFSERTEDAASPADEEQTMDVDAKEPTDQPPLEEVKATADSGMMDWLPGIEEHAAQGEGWKSQTAASETLVRYTPSAPILHGDLYAEPLDVSSTALQADSSTYPGSLPGTYSFSVNPTAPKAPPPPPAPPQTREQAQRTLLILERFDNLDVPIISRRSRAAKDTSIFEPDALKTTLLPDSYPPLNFEETKYLLARHKKKANEHYLVPMAARPGCALTSWPARYRDPKTGLVYADMHQYKAIQRVLAGGCQWSSVLGCWVGPAYGAMGRPARGVPDEFAGLTKPSLPAAATTTTTDGQAPGGETTGGAVAEKAG